MNPRRKHKVIKYSLATIAILVALAFIGAFIYAVVDYNNNPPSDSSAEDVSNPQITGGDVLEYFVNASDDGLYLSFYHGANSLTEMEEAITDDYFDMLEADITLRYYGLQNQTEEPIMAHPPAVNSDNTLQNWFIQVIASEKGIKMDMKNEEVVQYALAELRSHTNELIQPVWINADVMQGPNTLSAPINGSYFVQMVNEEFPNCTLSLGWTTGYRYAQENEEYSWESMDEMLALAKTTPQRITFPLRGSLARQSWYKFLWLVEQEDRFSITIWSPTSDPVPFADRVFVRDNYDTSKVFYDTASVEYVNSIKMEIEGERTIEKSFYTGGNVLDFFRTPERDAMNVTWAHRANKRDELIAALEDDSILMLEADVRINTEGVPVMAHTSADIPFSDQTLEQWLQMVIANSSSKGMKLDVKSTNALKPSFEIFQQFGDSIKVPVWLNSDILRGPNSVSIPVDATVFFEIAGTVFPHSTLSPGWTTAYNPIGENQNYTQAMVEEMYSYCKNSRQAITFPVRASLTGKSIEPLKWLVNKSNRYSLTVWHSGQEQVIIQELVNIRNSFKKNQVFYDLPTDMMQEFVTALENQ